MDTTPEILPQRLTVALVLAELTRMIAHELDVRIPEEHIDPTVPLIDGGLMLDSMVLFELITLIEARFGVAFPADNLSSEVFASLDVLARNIVGLAPAHGESP
jgi:acyl carrier protein